MGRSSAAIPRRACLDVKPDGAPALVAVDAASAATGNAHLPAMRSSIELKDPSGHLDRLQEHLDSVPQYGWLVRGKRRVQRVVAFASGDQLTAKPPRQSADTASNWRPE